MRTEVRVAGFGGQGVITIGNILGRAAVVYDRREAVLTKDYGPEKTGGWSKADLLLSDTDIMYPLVDDPGFLIALSQDGYERFAKTLRPDGVAFFEESLVHPGDDWDRETVMVPAIAAAEGLGKKVVANSVMVGAFAERAGVVSVEAARKALLDRVPKNTVELNLAAFEKGRELARRMDKAEVAP